MMPAVQENRGHSISKIARAAGVPRHVVSVLITHYKIACVKSSNHTVILPEGLPELIDVLREYPGVHPDFAERL